MAIKNNKGMKISYESSDLIQDVKEDIEEFGNIKMLACYKFEQGAKIYFDYYYLEDEVEGSYDTVEAKFLLKYLEKQNSVI